MFITVEGGEGVGKSSFLEGLSRSLTAFGVSTVTTYEPGGTPIGQAIRALFVCPPEGETPTPMAELYLISAARNQHVTKRIAPALDRGDWVLCDRYYDSTRVYQGMLGGIEPAVLEATIAASVEGCHPDMTFLLDCPAEVAMARVGSRLAETKSDEHLKGNRYDEASREFHHRLIASYRRLAEEFPERIRVLDAGRDPQTILDEAMSVLTPYLKRQP